MLQYNKQTLIHSSVMIQLYESFHYHATDWRAFKLFLGCTIHNDIFIVKMFELFFTSLYH